MANTQKKTGKILCTIIKLNHFHPTICGSQPGTLHHFLRRSDFIVRLCFSIFFSDTLLLLPFVEPYSAWEGVGGGGG